MALENSLDFLEYQEHQGYELGAFPCKNISQTIGL